MYKREEVYDTALEYFEGDELAANVWIDKYALKDSEGNIYEKSPDDMHKRMAKEFARIEDNYKITDSEWNNLSEYGQKRYPLTEAKIFNYFKNFNYIIPQGSVMASLGNKYNYSSLSNCVVIPEIYDSYGGICFSDQQLVQLFKRRCGVGLDISTLRPNGSITHNSAGSSTGAVSFMERFSNTTREVAQCLHGDTLILTKNGLKKIKDIKIGTEVWTKNGWIKVVDVLKNRKSLKVITTKFGNELVCSEDHIIHTINGEKPLKDIKIGDSITAIIGNGWQGKENKLINKPYKRVGLNQSNRLNDSIRIPQKINENIAYFLGYSYGDGYVSDDEIALSVSNYDHFEIIEKLVNIIKNEFNYNPNVIDKEKIGKYKIIRIHSKKLINFFDNNNILKQKSELIKFPEQLLNSNKEILFSFIAGYFDADGCNQKSKKVYKISSVSFNFLKTLQNILYSFGIISKINKYKRTNNNWKDIYTLSVNGERSQNIFRNMMTNSVKIDNFKYSKKRDFIRTIYKTGDFDTVSSRHSYISDNKHFLSYTTSYKLKEDLGHELTPVLIQDYLISVDDFDDGKLNDVYDLALEKEHLFFANGLYVHNSGRRGALMITMYVKHPDIENFVTIKEDLKKVTGANISVKLSDEFMEAVKNDTEFTLQFPINSDNSTITKTIKAKDLWNKIITAAHNSAEPGLMFWDKQHWYSTSSVYPKYQNVGTNPCAEIAMGGGDSCRLIALNMFGCVVNPFTKDAHFDFDKWYEVSYDGQRLNDDLVDLELESIKKILKKIDKDNEPDYIKDVERRTWQLLYETGKKGRRTGLGFTGLGDTLAALNLKYDTDKAIKFTEKICKKKCEAEFDSSIDMAIERGKFEDFDPKIEKTSKFIQMLEIELPHIYERMMKFGRRNISVSTVAPSGSISLLAQTTSGIEPLFMIEPYERRKKVLDDEEFNFVDDIGDKWKVFDVYHPKLKMFLDINPDKKVEDSFYISAADINWEKRIKMQASIQKYTTHSISSTINLSNDTTTETVGNIYFKGWEMGLKGVTIYRDGSRSGVLVSKDEKTVNDILKENNAPKRPKRLECDVVRFKNKGEQWVAFIGLHKLDNTKPYEIFTGRLEDFQIPNFVEKGWIIKEKEYDEDGVEIERRYDFEYTDKGGYVHTMRGLSRAFDEIYWDMAKMISAYLRHNIHMPTVINLIDSLKFEGEIIGTWKSGVKRILKRYIKVETDENGDVSMSICPNCLQKTLVNEGGCDHCLSCGYSRCE